MHLKNLKNRAEEFASYLNYKFSQDDFIYKVEELVEIKKIMSFVKSLCLLISQIEKNLANEAECNFKIASLEEKFKELRRKQEEENSENQIYEKEVLKEKSLEENCKEVKEEFIKKEDENAILQTNQISQIEQIPQTTIPEKKAKPIVEMLTHEKYEEEKNKALKKLDEKVAKLSSAQIEKILKEIRAIKDFRAAKEIRLH